MAGQAPLDASQAPQMIRDDALHLARDDIGVWKEVTISCYTRLKSQCALLRTISTAGWLHSRQVQVIRNMRENADIQLYRTS